ncbi:uncharacterized protein LOC128970119 [Indicator indicator]|uniref:uncharacterized protein LOC128970119 n=1 Tax=Indicator indicator TaxID=1002788 RepID=UPI0023DF6F78|nr:uncharacterized protein LOC128970119 [Indicator indicator]
MLLLQGLLAISLWSRGDAQAAPQQSPNLLRKVKGNSASMACKTGKEDILHWYRQLPGEPPKRIAYFLRNTFFDHDQHKTKFQILKHSSEPRYRLMINHLTPQDSGTYFCAYWRSHVITALDRQRSAADLTERKTDFPIGGDMQAAPEQTPEFLMQAPGSSASLACQISEDAVLHWYRQLPGEPPKRILCFWRQNTVTDNSREQGKFQANMLLLLAALMATASWSHGFAQEFPVQSPISITKFRKSARMSCEFPTASSLDSSVIHWYQQKEGKAPVRLLYFAEGRASVESVFQAERYMVENVPGRSRCVLTISNVVPDDTATYYCAYWDPWSSWVKYFGSGTKLIVSNKQISAPANSEILQKKHDNQITYVCLIEKFYPEVIQVKWTDGENKEVTDNVVKGDTWKLTKEDKYSISSWLTVPAENKDKNYYCKYEHESQQRSLPAKGHFTADHSSKHGALKDNVCNWDGQKLTPSCISHQASCIRENPELESCCWCGGSLVVQGCRLAREAAVITQGKWRRSIGQTVARVTKDSYS